MRIGWRREPMDALLAEREPSLLAYAYAISGGDAATADEILERALEAVFARARGLLPTDEAERRVRLTLASTYLRRDRRRRRWTAVRQLFRPHDWTTDAAPSATADATIGALRSIGPRERVCLLRYILDGRTIEEITHEVSLPPERVRAGLRGAIATLEAHLGPVGAIDLDSVPVVGRGPS